MAEFEEILAKIREIADQYHASGQNELWADAEGDFEQYQNWHDGGETGRCPIDITKYTGEITSDVEEIPVDTSDFEISEEEVVAPRRDDARMNRLITDAINSMGREDFDEAERLIKEALEIDPSAQEARETLKHIQTAKSEKTRKTLIYTLKYVDDVGPLKVALDDARNELIKDPDDAEIAKLVEIAKARFDDIRKVQGQVTTAEAAEDYFTVIKGIAMMEDTRDKGGTTFFDERVKQDRAIHEVLSDFTSRMGPLAVALVNKKFSHVEAYLPVEGKRNPKSALETLKECVSLKGIEENTRTEIEARIKKVSEEVVQWEKAEKEFKKAENLQLNDFERFQFFLAAKAVYPQHSDVIDHEHDYALNASIYLTEILDNSITRHSKLLAHEAAAALDQRMKNQADKPLPLFEDARLEIQDILIKVNRIPEEHATGRLLKAKEKANSFLTKLEKVENRRKEIRSTYLRITDETRRNPQTGITSLKSLDSATLEDPEIKYLRGALKLNLNVDGHIKIAKTHFDSRKFKDCIDELDQIGDPGSMKEEIDQLKKNAELRFYQEQILEAWGKKFFDDGFEKIKLVFLEKNNNAELVEEITRDSKLHEKEADFQKRREVDENNRIREQTTELRKDWDQILATTVTSQNLFDWVERSIKLLLNVLEVSRLPSTQEGKWIVWANEIKKTIHDRAFATLLDVVGKAETREQITNLYRIAQRLNQYLLVETQEDRTCRRKINLAYFSAIQQDYERNENWAEIVRNWEEAYIEFGGEPAFWDKLHACRFDAVKHTIMIALRKFEFEKAISMAKLIDLPFTFDPQSPTPFTSEEDQELGELAKQAELMRTAHGLFEQKDYITMSETLLAGIKDNKPQVLVDYRRELVNRAIKLLSDEGDAVVQGNFAQGVLCFSTILRLDPENVLARGRIDKYRENVYAEIRNIQKETEEIDPSVDIDIQFHQNHERGLTLQSLTAAVTFLDGKNTQVRKALESASQENIRVHAELEKLKNIIQDLSDESPVWQSILARGTWNLGQNRIDEFRQINSNHHSLNVLEARLRNAAEVSKRRKAMKETLEHAYLQDNFEEFTTNYQSLMTELFRESPGKEVPFDKYRIFPEGFSFFDPFLQGESKEVPFFHRAGEEFCVKCLVDLRIPNKKLFEKYANNVQEECAILKTTYTDLESRPESFDTLTKCESFVALCKLKWVELARPIEDPLSMTAEELLNNALNAISIGKTNEEIVSKRIISLRQKHDACQKELTDIIGLVNMHQFSQAQQKLIPIRDFYIEGENEYRQFIEQTLRVCSGTTETTTKKSIFGGRGR